MPALVSDRLLDAVAISESDGDLAKSLRARYCGDLVQRVALYEGCSAGRRRAAVACIRGICSELIGVIYQLFILFSSYFTRSFACRFCRPRAAGVEPCGPHESRRGCGPPMPSRRHGSRTVEPVVCRASSARCALAASASGNVWLTVTRTAPLPTTSNSACAELSSSARLAV